jgi:hypothetical protein
MRGHCLTVAWLRAITSSAAFFETRKYGATDRARFGLLEGEYGRLGPIYKLWGLVRLPLGELEGIGVQCRNMAGRDVLVKPKADASAQRTRLACRCR